MHGFIKEIIFKAVVTTDSYKGMKTCAKHDVSNELAVMLIRNNLEKTAMLTIQNGYLSQQISVWKCSLTLNNKIIRQNICDECPRSNLYATPLRVPVSCTSSAKMRSRSMEHSETFPSTPIQDSVPRSAHSPRSSSKTPRLRQRVFASLERQADKMINLLTPRKVKNNQPEMLKQTKTMVNVSITSSKNPDRVRRELMRVFAEQNITTDYHGWKISGRKKDEFNRMMTVELEVVWIEMGNKEKLVGVKRKRLNGDAFLYKKSESQICVIIMRRTCLSTVYHQYIPNFIIGEEEKFVLVKRDVKYKMTFGIKYDMFPPSRRPSHVLVKRIFLDRVSWAHRDAFFPMANTISLGSGTVIDYYEPIDPKNLEVRWKT
ncbi:unnamed protein product [Brugia timori]|uniref:PAZ domain-containing protein n=1 Tax=Brugia timori TaxID=42155 RepID=A0A0R3QND1_9BILA|nr:unnamed protein product [Brugia timori]